MELTYWEKHTWSLVCCNGNNAYKSIALEQYQPWNIPPPDLVDFTGGKTNGKSALGNSTWRFAQPTSRRRTGEVRPGSPTAGGETTRIPLVAQLGTAWGRDGNLPPADKLAQLGTGSTPPSPFASH